MKRTSLFLYLGLLAGCLALAYHTWVREPAKPGDRVVALIDDEATIKEFNLSGDMAILKPKSTNPEHRPIFLTRDFAIQGVVIATIANF